MTTIQISTRVDDQIKDMAQKVFERQGLDISTALKMFITKTAYEQEVPLSLKNSETTTPYPSDWFNDERISNRKKDYWSGFQKFSSSKTRLIQKRRYKGVFQWLEMSESIALWLLI